MPPESTHSSLDQFSARHARLIEALYAEANCAQRELSLDAFAESLRRSAERRFSDPTCSPSKLGTNKRDGATGPSASEIELYLKSLHLEDLGLACACAAGIETAWEYFVAKFRSDLRSGARAILGASGSRNETRAEELADSLHAELYGIRSATDGKRKSLFEYFHGRSKLSTWLRAVMAQRHVDMLRVVGKTESLDEEELANNPREPPGRLDSAPADPHRENYLSRLDRALSTSLANLTPRDHMILSSYYLDKLRLAEIGRILGEHESTVSRQLDRVRRGLRESVEQRLLRGAPAEDGCAAEPPMDQAQVDLAFEYALEDWPFDLSLALSKPKSAVDPPDK